MAGGSPPSILIAGFAVVAVFVPLCILAIILRFVCSKRTLGVGIEDWLALTGLVFWLGWVACCLTLALMYSAGHIETALKAEYSAAVVAPFGELFTKLSLLFLYHRIFGVRQSYSLWIKFFGLVQAGEAVAAQFIALFQCSPVNKYWDSTVTHGSCIRAGPWVAGVESVNSFVDFGMTILAMIMVNDLNLRTSTKWKLYAVFVLGAFAGVIGFVKIFLSYHAAINDQLTRGVWSTAQWAVSIICSCAVVFKPILPKGTLLTRLFSKLSSYGSRIKLTNKASTIRLNRRSNESQERFETGLPADNIANFTEHIDMGKYSESLKKHDYDTQGVAL
ncbi:integral membrane protein [Hypoxylon argillaceum]|nr:integral membrane protein [Hypoxylon argillaceum]